MNMLKTFFEVGCKKELFDGLKITQEKELCEECMGQYPVMTFAYGDFASYDENAHACVIEELET
jgi:hypothetical protein